MTLTPDTEYYYRFWLLESHPAPVCWMLSEWENTTMRTHSIFHAVMMMMTFHNLTASGGNMHRLKVQLLNCDCNIDEYGLRLCFSVHAGWKGMTWTKCVLWLLLVLFPFLFFTYRASSIGQLNLRITVVSLQYLEHIFTLPRTPWAVCTLRKGTFFYSECSIKSVKLLKHW